MKPDYVPDVLSNRERLADAAGDLYMALTLLLGSIDAYGPDFAHEEWYKKLETRANAALQKAESGDSSESSPEGLA